LITPCLDAGQPGTALSRLNARQSEIFEEFRGKAHSNFLVVFDIWRKKIPSGSEKCAGFLVDEFSELVHTTK